MSVITLDQARQIIEGAFAKREESGFKPLAVCVLDAGGHLRAFDRQDEASNLRFEIAFGKAFGAIGLGVGSRALMARAETQPYFVSAANGAFGGALIPVPGGVLVRTSDGELIGAVGVSGDTSDNDEAAALAGVASVGLVADAGGSDKDRADFSSAGLVGSEYMTDAMGSGEGPFLRSLHVEAFDRFYDAELAFVSSITAIVGPNGVGKSSLLKLAGLPYRQFDSSRVEPFPTDNARATVEYTLTDDAAAPLDLTRTTATFSDGGWNHAVFDRSVFFFDLSDYAMARAHGVKEVVSSAAADAIAVTLGLPSGPVARSAENFVGAQAQLAALFGALYSAPAGALFLIDDVETGLQGIAVRRLVEQLAAASVSQNVQIIFTTRALEALIPLPSAAVLTVAQDAVFAGKPDGALLNLLGGGLDVDLVVFVESAFVGEVAWATLRTYNKFIGPIGLDRVVVCVIENAQSVEAVTNHHNRAHGSGFPALAFLAKPDTDALAIIFGGTGDPAYFIIDEVTRLFPGSLPKLTGMMQQTPEDQDRVEQSVLACRKDNRDSKVVFREIGQAMYGTTDVRIQRAFTMTWAQTHLDTLRAMLEPVMEYIPTAL